MGGGAPAAGPAWEWPSRAGEGPATSAAAAAAAHSCHLAMEPPGAGPAARDVRPRSMRGASASSPSRKPSESSSPTPNPAPATPARTRIRSRVADLVTRDARAGSGGVGAGGARGPDRVSQGLWVLLLENLSPKKNRIKKPCPLLPKVAKNGHFIAKVVNKLEKNKGSKPVCM